MDLERDAEVGAELEESPLALKIKVENEANASAAQRNHACRLVIGLRNVRLEVVVDVHAPAW